MYDYTMNKTTLISLIIGIVIVLIVVIFFWSFFGSGKVYASRVTLSHNDKRKDVSVGNIKIYDDKNKQLLPIDVKNISSNASINITFSDEDHLIKRIDVQDIPANCQISLYNKKGFVTYKRDITTDIRGGQNGAISFTL
jgi:hypothetical protein